MFNRLNETETTTLLTETVEQGQLRKV